MPVREITRSVRSEDAGRIDRLVAQLIDFSRARVRGLMSHEGVKLNGVVCTDIGQPVVEGDQILITYDPQRKYPEKAQPRVSRHFKIVFEDADLLVVNKEAGVLTVPTDRRESLTLVDLLAAHLNGHQKGRKKPHVIHRLDKDTSGLLVFGRTHSAADSIIKQFAARKPEREYEAIVAGCLPQDSGTIRSHLQTDRSLNQRSSHDGKGEEAITHYEVSARFADATQIKVRLETGRRNQIRVHFAEQGHPILGDVRYESDLSGHRNWPFRRLALHARVLGFVHPTNGERLRFEQPLPDEFLRFKNSARPFVKA